MQVVGNCPQCGAPIWALMDFPPADVWKPPENTYSCECRKVKTPVPKCRGHPETEISDDSDWVLGGT